MPVDVRACVQHAARELRLHDGVEPRLDDFLHELRRQYVLHRELRERHAARALERLINLLREAVEVVRRDQLALEELQAALLLFEQLVDRMLNVRQIDV